MMKLKFLMPLLVLGLGITACGGASTTTGPSSPSLPSEETTVAPSETPTEAPTEETTSDLPEGITQFDLDYKGISINNSYESSDYNFSGCLTDIAIGSWLVANDELLIKISIKEGTDPVYTFAFDDESVAKVIEKETNGTKNYYIKGLKTGGTVFKIFADGDLIYRNAVNVRVPIKDTKIMFNQIAKADYWYGVFTKITGSGDYRLLFEPNDVTGLDTSCTLSLVELEQDYGTVKFDIDVDSCKEMTYEALHAYEFRLNVTQPVKEIEPIIMRVSLALDVLYIYDKVTITDFFRPVTL